MISIIDPGTIRDISNDLLMPNGKLKLLSSLDYAKYTTQELQLFGYKNARYGIPTIELVEYIKTIIGDRSAIEIGSGHGDLGYHLGIPMTDSKIQTTLEIKAYYEALRQPLIDYPEDVEKIEALDAVKKYKPQVVVGSWLTTYSAGPAEYGSSPAGIKEDEILNLVETYILVGNLDSHADKPILKTHGGYEKKGSFIISRAKNPQNNRIFIIKG
jgi:hypothetical protein